MKCRTTLEKSFYALEHKTGALIIGVILSIFTFFIACASVLLLFSDELKEEVILEDPKFGDINYGDLNRALFCISIFFGVYFWFSIQLIYGALVYSENKIFPFLMIHLVFTVNALVVTFIFITTKYLGLFFDIIMLYFLVCIWSYYSEIKQAKIQQQSPV